MKLHQYDPRTLRCILCGGRKSMHPNNECKDPHEYKDGICIHCNTKMQDVFKVSEDCLTLRLAYPRPTTIYHYSFIVEIDHAICPACLLQLLPVEKSRHIQATPEQFEKFRAQCKTYGIVLERISRAPVPKWEEIP